MNIDELHVEWDEKRLTPVKVMGVGGGGGYAVNYMYQQGIHGVSFVICNTDAGALEISPVPEKIRMGSLGLWCDPVSGYEAALESLDKIRETLDTSTEILFLVAGMGGSIGTGATPVIARVAKELGILTVAVVTIPFNFEGQARMEQAKQGVCELKNHVDSLIIINNERLHEINCDLSINDLFLKSDQKLLMTVKSIAEMITIQGVINIDLKDMKTFMSNSGITVTGSGSASGENRARDAVTSAIHSIFFNNIMNNIDARRIMLKIMSGSGENEMKMDEVSEILNFVTGLIKNASMIWGVGIDDSFGDTLSVNIIVTDFINNQNLINVNHNK